MKLSSVFGLVLLIIVCVTGSAAGQTAAGPSVMMRADRLTQIAKHVVMAWGNAQVQGPGFHLRADMIEVRSDPSAPADSLPIQIIAEGNVVLSRGGEGLRLDRVELNPQSGSGTFQLPRDN